MPYSNGSSHNRACDGYLLCRAYVILAARDWAGDGVVGGNFRHHADYERGWRNVADIRNGAPVVAQMVMRRRAGYGLRQTYA